MKRPNFNDYPEYIISPTPKLKPKSRYADALDDYIAYLENKILSFDVASYMHESDNT